MMTKTNKTPLTQRQRAMFWSTFAKACANMGVFGAADRDEYRHQMLEEETGKVHLADLNRTKDFDRVMYRLYSEAGDFEGAAQFVVCDERRMGFLIKVVCMQLMQLKGSGESEARQYLGGLLDQARVPNGVRTDDNSYWMDLSFRDCLKVFAMLDIHRRRLLKARGFRSTAFSPAFRYTVNGTMTFRDPVNPIYYAHAAFRVNFIDDSAAE